MALSFEFSATSKERAVKKSSNLVTKVCLYCGKEFQVPAWYGKGNYCSRECSFNAKKVEHKPNMICEVCGKEYYLKPSHIGLSKHHCCSRKCSDTLKRSIYSGEYNPNFKGGKIIERGKYTNYYLIMSKDHPYKNKDGYVREHILVVEENYKLFDSKYFEKIDGKFYLKQDIDVHHKNKNGLDNRIENLIPCTRSEHKQYHVEINRQIALGNFNKSGVFKGGELLENHIDSDNQQPSIDGDINKGSTTRNRISNLHFKFKR